MSERFLATSFGNISMGKMGENTKPGSFLQKPPEILVYAIYIECRNPFRVCYLIYLNTRCGWGGIWHPRGEHHSNLCRFA